MGDLDLSHFNRAYVALVPKKEGARKIGDFHPISLINSMFKIISKVLAQRLKSKINGLIDSPQSTFLHGQSILDCVSSTQKIISSCSKYKWPMFFLKLDLLKHLTRLVGTSFYRPSEPEVLERYSVDEFLLCLALVSPLFLSTVSREHLSDVNMD